MPEIKEVYYQSIYLNPHAPEWQNRIIFIDPIFDSEVRAIMTLKVMKLENTWCYVYSGLKSSIESFRDAAEEMDTSEHLGEESQDFIMSALDALAKEYNLSLVYKRNIGDGSISKPEKVESSKKLDWNLVTDKLKQELDSDLKYVQNKVYKSIVCDKCIVGIYDNILAKDWLIELGIKPDSDKTYITVFIPGSETETHIASLNQESSNEDAFKAILSALDFATQNVVLASAKHVNKIQFLLKTTNSSYIDKMKDDITKRGLTKKLERQLA